MSSPNRDAEVFLRVDGIWVKPEEVMFIVHQPEYADGDEKSVELKEV